MNLLFSQYRSDVSSEVVQDKEMYLKVKECKISKIIWGDKTDLNHHRH